MTLWMTNTSFNHLLGYRFAYQLFFAWFKSVSNYSFKSYSGSSFIRSFIILIEDKWICWEIRKMKQESSRSFFSLPSSSAKNNKYAGYKRHENKDSEEVINDANEKCKPHKSHESVDFASSGKILVLIVHNNNHRLDVRSKHQFTTCSITLPLVPAVSQEHWVADECFLSNTLAFLSASINIKSTELNHLQAHLVCHHTTFHSRWCGLLIRDMSLSSIIKEHEKHPSLPPLFLHHRQREHHEELIPLDQLLGGNEIPEKQWSR